MPPILQTRSKHVFPVVRFLQRIGEPVERRLRQARLPIDCLENPESLIPSHGAFLFREVAARAVGLANIALEASQGIEIANLGILAR